MDETGPSLPSEDGSRLTPDHQSAPSGDTKISRFMSFWMFVGKRQTVCEVPGVQMHKSDTSVRKARA
jgi:hypothetical protein